MSSVLIPIPAIDFDPTEVAVSWSVLAALGHDVRFATPDGKAGAADPMMLSGTGLDPWSRLHFLRRLRLVGLILRANADARAAYDKMIASSAFQSPMRWAEIDVDKFDGLLLGGGHRARGMRPFIESTVLQACVAHFFDADKPVAAICHGVLLAARSKRADGRSVLYGRKTTALTWKQERTASGVAHVGRWWDRNYYRTYTEAPDQPAGFMSVQHEVTRALAAPSDFIDVPDHHPDHIRKTSGLFRDTLTDSRSAWVVQDHKYVSARWPGDAHSFAQIFAALLDSCANIATVCEKLRAR
jgi:putative intracellular protease/amidase